MAKYRPLYTRIWKDPDFLKYSAEDKLLFIYLCTNDSTSDTGIYPLSPETLANETGIPLETVQQRLGNGCLKNVDYDLDTQYVFVRKFRRYNSGGRADLIAKAIANDFRVSHHVPHWDAFVQEYPEFKAMLATVKQRLSNGYPTDEETVLIDNPNLNNNLSDESQVEETVGELLEQWKLDDDTKATLNAGRRDVFEGIGERRKYKSPNSAKEAQAITWMLKEGFSVEQVLGTYDMMKKDEFWAARHLDMQSVRKQIGAITQASNPRAQGMKASEGRQGQRYDMTPPAGKD